MHCAGIQTGASKNKQGNNLKIRNSWLPLDRRQGDNIGKEHVDDAAVLRL